jgi:conserved oligomeric Golgi complex subunit 3
MILGNDISTSESTSDDEEEDANESIVPQTPADETESNGLQRLQIGQLLQMILQDAQTRLVFKAQAIIQSEIRLHVATESDLRYPEKLIGLFLN